MSPEDIIESQKCTLLGQAVQDQQVSEPHVQHLVILWKDSFTMTKDQAGR